MKKEFLQNFQIDGKGLPEEAINAILEENERDMKAATTHPEENGATGGKMFSQEDVNRIVSERLAKEKAKTEPPKEDEREQALKMREARLDCREYIAGKKYPVELLDILNTGDAESFKAAADKLMETFPAMSTRDMPPPYAPGTGTYAMLYENPIADAFKPPQY